MKKLILLIIAITALCLAAIYLLRSPGRATNDNTILTTQSEGTGVPNDQLAAKRTEQFMDNLNEIASR
jgi:hypothetical protein